MTNPIADPIVEVPDTDAMSPLVHMDSTPEGAVTVWINRPAKKNAFDAATIAALRQTFETLHGAEGVRIVFLRGVGGAFSAGADLNWMKRAATHTKEDNVRDAVNLAEMLQWPTSRVEAALQALALPLGVVRDADVLAARGMIRRAVAPSRGLRPGPPASTRSPVHRKRLRTSLRTRIRAIRPSMVDADPPPAWEGVLEKRGRFLLVASQWRRRYVRIADDTLDKMFTGMGGGKSKKKKGAKKKNTALMHTFDILSSFATIKVDAPLSKDAIADTIKVIGEKKEDFLVKQKEGLKKLLWLQRCLHFNNGIIEIGLILGP